MLKYFVRGFENALSKAMCESLIDWFESNPPDVQMRDGVTTGRNDKQLWLPEASELYKPLQKVKFSMLSYYLKEFPYAYRGKKKLLTPESKIQRTNPMGGGFHNFHAEISHYENALRALVWTLYLNDIPQGEGETEFLYEHKRIASVKGRVVICPTAFTHTHRGNPPLNRAKYMINGWMEFITL